MGVIYYTPTQLLVINITTTKGKTMIKDILNEVDTLEKALAELVGAFLI